MSTQPQTPLPQVGKLVSVVPVGLKEAALDSPTFRATNLHFCDQIEFIEKWLDGYARAATKLASELTALESVVSSFLSYSTHPLAVSEAVVDHDYTLLAMKRCGEGSKDLWNGLVASTKKMEALIAEPIRVFVHEDLRRFKDTRRALELSQKQYDYLHARYASQSKSKEASALREEAFQLHEARKAYLRAAMDFSLEAPQICNALNRLLVRISFDQWREFRGFHNNNSATFSKWAHEMDRIKGWVHEMEASDRSSKRELHSARKQIEEAAELVARPSRELEDYSISTVPYLGSRPLSTLNMGKEARPEKQGWVNLRTLSGKPTRTVWVKRWAFLKHGIFGCLVQGARTGGVEESERIGVLLCSVRPAFQEERRFCFQVKTKNNSIVMQAETQKELMDWIGAFEAAKQKALDNPTSTDLSISGKITLQDPAFAISQPPAPEFTADPHDSLTPHHNDESSSTDHRGSSLPIPERDALAFRNSTEVSSSRRLTGLDGEGSAREHTSRIIQKLDLHRKSSNAVSASPAFPGPTGGIASLISASHHILPYSGTAPVNVADVDGNRSRSLSNLDEPGANLAPDTLANPPAPTSMSKAAVIVNTERGIGLGLVDSTGGMPSGMMANLWGSSNWGFINKLQREQPQYAHGNQDGTSEGRSSSVMSDPDKGTIAAQPDALGASPASKQPSGPRHRQTVSLDGDASELQRAVIGVGITEFEYPSIYPQQLKIQDAQFRLLFPDVKKEEAVVLVFRATWSPNDQQEFPGRAYATTRNIYFYSHHFGLVLTTSVSLDSIKEVTAAPGRDCDFLFLHTIPPLGSDTPGRITIKTFLEPLKLLQKRVNFLIEESIAVEPISLEGVIKELIKLDTGSPNGPSSVDSWEDVSPGLDKHDGGSLVAHSRGNDLRVPIYIDKALDLDGGKAGRGRDIPKFRLPTQPVEYVPQGDLTLATEKVLDISPKALFHILFGDKSAVWQLLLHERQARDIRQGPWASTESRHLRRDFQYRIATTDVLGRTYDNAISDYQIIDVLNDHLCYVITDKRTPWHLPLRRSFRLVSKVVVTFVAKSKSKLAIYTKVEWLKSPYGFKNIIDKKASDDLEQDALDLVDLVSDQVRRLGAHSRTKKAITIFGHIGRQSHVSHFTGVGANLKVEPRKPRTQRTMHQLLLETTLSFLESTVSLFMMWAIDIVRWSWKTVSAHKVILVLLITSGLLNGFYSSRDTWDWWHERHASNFMARLGVQPDLVMSKAIYIRDIDEAVANSTIWTNTGNASSCFSAFHEQAMRYSELPLSLSTTGPRDPVAKSATKRFQQTRERLGTYRHNLLVALRVVNSIEREVIQNEWERWLREELRRCRQVEILLGGNAAEDDTESEPAQAERIFAENAGSVKQWYDRYCTSCLQEQEQVHQNDRENLLP